MATLSAAELASLERNRPEEFEDSAPCEEVIPVQDWQAYMAKADESLAQN